MLQSVIILTWSNILDAKIPYLISQINLRGNVVDVLDIFYFFCQGNLKVDVVELLALPNI